MKAHIMCSKRRILWTIGLIWPMGFLIALPYVIYNEVARPGRNAFAICGIHPRNPIRRISDYYIFALLYVLPLVLQSVLYTMISRRLFSGLQNLRASMPKEERTPEAIRARKGVVKMLIACVTVYFVTYSPIQVQLLYKEISGGPFKQTFSFRIFVIILGYINSSVNPILYSIFSQKFRSKFMKSFYACSRDSNAAGTQLRAVRSGTYTTYRGVSQTSRLSCTGDKNNSVKGEQM